jgi:SAM-dependent methyltransferase
MSSLQTPVHHDEYAVEAYDALAGAYDLLTANYCHDTWLERIELLARDHGLRGDRVLDIACGTGKSFQPLARRGYRITACDISPRMVEIARAKAPEAAISVEDMRELPRLGRFDLITCLDDAVNYLLSEDALEGFLDGVARNLAADGIAVFDVNSLKLYREDFRQDWVADDPRGFIAWTCASDAEVIPGARVAATVYVFSPRGDDWVRSVSRHEQRHWPRSAIERAAANASLRIAAVHGQHRGARIEPSFGEREHNKALYFAVHQERGTRMRVIGP